MIDTLAVLGGSPTYPDGLPFVRPAVPALERVTRRLAPSYDEGRLTNGPLVRELEDVAAARLGVPHVVAVSTCTTGLLLALRVLEHLGEVPPQSSVLLPSFTFSASAHAVAWNGHRCRFAECDVDSFQLDVDDAKSRAEGVGAVLATHVFGAPCRPEAVEQLAASLGVPAVFDAAHAFGAARAGRAIGGFGAVEVFSLTPTKPLVAGEGGLVATARAEVAEVLRIARDYGNPGDYDTRLIGLNGRMSELHAAVALCSLDAFDGDLARRRELAERYCRRFDDVPGVAVQRVDAADASTWKDFTIAIDSGALGVDRDTVVRVLAAEGVDTRNYFDPPAHRQRSHAADAVELPVTDDVASRVVSLPIYPSLRDHDVDAITALVARAGECAAALRR